MKEAYVHLAHILIFSTFLGYIGIQQSSMSKILYNIILATGIIVILYHIYKSLYKKDAWINYIHILIVGPLLVYIGLMKEETPRKFFELILMLAFASLGYHGYYLFIDV
jgi:hypothetical protein